MTRAERLKALDGRSFAQKYGNDTWPDEPGRYAVSEFSDRYGESFWSIRDTLDEVAQLIRGSDVLDVVDLDTGESVPYTITVAFDTVEFGAPA